jgi:hypothetical protein
MEEIKQKAYNDELNEAYDEIHPSETQRALSPCELVDNPDFPEDSLEKRGYTNKNLEKKNYVNQK